MSQLGNSQDSLRTRQAFQTSDHEMRPPQIHPSARVNAPAIGILVASITGVVFAVIGLLGNLPGVRQGSVGALGSEQDLEQVEVSLGERVFEVLQPAVGFVIGVIGIIGARQMRNLEKYQLSVAASILIMIPCSSLHCLLGLPFGVWAIIVLNDPHVKNAFRS